MYVVHTIWLPAPQRRLAVWAETSAAVRRARCVQAPPRQSRRRAARTTPLPHPFALDRERLEMVIFNLYAIAATQVGTWSSCTLHLPTTAHGPQPSPELIADDAAEAPAALAPWRMPALLISEAHAGDFLRSLPFEPPHGVAYGGATRFWLQLARWTLELVSRQCVVPAVVARAQRNQTVYEGRWLVTFGAGDAPRLHQLAQAMPPVCRAWRAPADAPPSDVYDTLTDFLQCAADAFVRQHVYENARYSMVPERRGRGVSLEQQWLAALTSERPELRGAPDDLAAFARAAADWLAPVRAEDNAPFRTCFKLEAPDPKDTRADAWRLSFHLQARDDPSILLPAEQVWRTRSASLTHLKRVLANPHEHVLASLGAASRLFPRLNDALAESKPTGLALTTTEAYDFLRATAPVLEQSGYGVLLPSWWRAANERLSVQLRLRPAETAATAAAASGMLGMRALLEFDWQFAIGDQVLTAAEFKRIVALKRPLVPLRGRWVELQRDQIETAIAFFERQRAAGGLTLAQALGLGIGADDAAFGLPVSAVTGEDWVADALECLQNPARVRPLAAPRAFRGTLRPYQARGMAWLAFLARLGFGGCLADDMGLGKTIELLAFLLHYRSADEQDTAAVRHAPWLIVCPMSVVSNWAREVERFAPSLRVLVHHGLGRHAGDAFAEQAAQHDIVLTTYALAQRDTAHLARVEWDGIVLDEAQNIKNPDAKQTQAVRRLNAPLRIAMTGTPVENRLAELWSIMEFLNPGYLGPARAFRTRFAIPVERYHDTERATLLKRLVQPFVLRRVKTDTTIISDLPEKMEMTVLCNLTREQATLYEAVVQDMLARIEASTGIERKGLILATLTKLKQVCNHPAQFLDDGSALSGRSGKLARIEEMLEEALAERDKALVFTQYAEMGRMLKTALQERFGREALFLHGGSTKKQRDAMIARFQHDDNGPPVFILSLKAGGVGLNLTAATRVFHYDRWWNPAVENQATDRAFRIGQRRAVQVHKFTCAGTVEERIAAMIEEKKDLAERIVGACESWITELSTDHLRELFTLRRDAVMEG